jgi:hypothetical protein
VADPDKNLTAQSTTQFRWLKRCPKCAYDLTGHPEEGTCPECGRKYDQSMIVLFGWGAGQRANLRTASKRALPKIAFWLVIGLLPILLMIPGATKWVLLGAMLWIAAIALFARSEDPGVPPVRVGFSRDGCVQLDGVNPLPEALRTVPLAMFAYFMLRNSGVAAIAFIAILAMGLLPVAFRSWGRWRKSRLLAEPEFAADIDLTALTPWKEVTEVRVTSHTPSTWRITMKRKRTFWDTQEEAVDVEVELTREEATTLEITLKTWRSFAINPPSAASAEPAR